MKKLLYYALLSIICGSYFGERSLAFSIDPLTKDQFVKINRNETILIIGVQHAPGQFWSEKFSPAHIRATLEAFDPQVVGVESNPEWFAKGQFYKATYEAEHIAVPFARDKKISVYGIDWIGEKNYSQQGHALEVRAIKKILESSTVDSAQYRYGLSSWNYQLPAQNNPELDFYALNGIETGEKNLKWIDEGKDKNGSPQEYMEDRDNHIVDYITAVADQHSGSRIAIVIGAMHKSDLERKLRAKGFKVIGPQQVGQSIPVSDGEKMDDLLKAQDIAAILAESWDSTPQSGGTRARTERLLNRLLKLSDRDPKARGWGEYFSARHKMLAGDFAAARTAFEIISRSEKLLEFPYRGYRWRHYLTIQQAALLELGRIADLQKRREEAVSYYKRLLLSITIPEYSEDYHDKYLFYATTYNAIRGLIQTTYSIESEKSVANPQIAALGPTTQSSEEMKKALNLSRSGKWSEAATLIEDILKKGNAPPNERCEGYVIAASAYAKDKKTSDARRHLQSFDAKCRELPAESWLVQRRKQIEVLLK